jgi:hypothetical protein
MKLASNQLNLGWMLICLDLLDFKSVLSTTIQKRLTTDKLFRVAVVLLAKILLLP